jgi:hypothetical protein
VCRASPKSQDFITGRMNYELCANVNTDGNCQKYEAIEKPSQPPMEEPSLDWVEPDNKSLIQRIKGLL